MSKKNKYQEERQVPFGNQQSDDIRDVDNAVFGGEVDWSGGNRIVAKSLPIMQIEADVTQPRRIAPREVRGSWDGSPEGVPALLDEWHDAVMDTVDDLPIEKILNGKMPPFGNEKNPYGATGAIVVDEFLRLLDLAAQIKDVGLQQAIGVMILPRNRYRIIFGERRWMAFHVLAHFIGDKWNQIPAKVVDISPFDVAKIQAAENMQRVELNAIERARQFAKLIIEARRDNPETPYDSWNALVVAGGCDRPWFAQVHDGNIHPIPYGMGPIFEQTLGISTGQMRQYRGLLQMFDDWHVDNALWDMGDDHNWAEQFMREIREFIDLDTVRTILKESPDPEDTLREVIAAEKEARRRMKEKARTVTTVTHVAEDEREETSETLQTPVDKSTWESYKWVGKEAWAGPQKVFVVDCPSPNSVEVEFVKDGVKQIRVIGVGALYEHAAGDTPPQPLPEAAGRGFNNADTPKPDTASTYVDKHGVVIKTGDTVMTRRGAEAKVIGFNGRYVEVESKNQFVSKGHYPEWLEVVTSPPNPLSTRREGEQSPTKKTETGLEKSAYPEQGKTSASQLIGKPMLYKGEPTIVIADAGDNTVLIQLGKEREVVPIGDLSFHPEPELDDDDIAAEEYLSDEANGTRQGLVFAEDDVIRRYLAPYHALSIVLENEHATTAIEWLSHLTYERTNRQQLESAMNHVLTHIENINSAVEEIVFEQLRLKLEAEYGENG